MSRKQTATSRSHGLSADLGSLPLWAGLPDVELAAMAAGLTERWAEEGDLLLRQGSTEAGLGFVLEGQVAVRADGKELTRLGPGDPFGEISAILDEPAAGDVVALRRVRFAMLARDQVPSFLQRHPSFAYRLLQAEARRLHDPTRWFADAPPRAAAAPTWSPETWRAKPALQQPSYPDPAAVEAAVNEVRAQPPLEFAGEARRLTSALAEVAAGRAFLLQAGDCAESFHELSAPAVRERLRIILQMAVVLTYGSGLHIVKVGRMAGQFAKPRSSSIERVGDTELPVFRGHIVNDEAPVAERRIPDPARMLQAYHQSASRLNLLRAFITGGFASLSQVHAWNREFVAASPVGERYESVATEIDRAIRFMRAARMDLDNEAMNRLEFWTSHEALLLPYEEALTRREDATGDWYDCSAHMLWIGERTRQLDGAHVEFLAGVRNPIGCKVGPGATGADVVALAERLNPERVPGRLTFISRMGAANAGDALPPLLAAVREAGHPVVWACDPMHANTTLTSSGRKTRHVEDVLTEVQAFFAACAAEGVWPGGLHVELTADDVTECLGGGEDLKEEDLDLRYATICDPRLNGRQSLDLAFRVAEMLRAFPVHAPGP